MAVSALPVYLSGTTVGSVGVVEEFGAGSLLTHQNAQGKASLAAFAGASGQIIFTVTIGSGSYYYKQTGSYFSVEKWGFDNDSQDPGEGAPAPDFFGSINNSGTYTDGGSNSREIIEASVQEVVGPRANNDGWFFYFGLNGGSIPNTDATFVSITTVSTDGTKTWTRASATYSGSLNGESYWLWNDNTDSVSASSPVGSARTSFTVEINL